MRGRRATGPRAPPNGFEVMSREDASLFSRLITCRYDRGAILITTNKSVRDSTELLAGDEVLAAAILDRLPHRSNVLNIKGRSYRLRDLEDISRKKAPAPCGALKAGRAQTLAVRPPSTPPLHETISKTGCRLNPQTWTSLERCAAPVGGPRSVQRRCVRASQSDEDVGCVELRKARVAEGQDVTGRIAIEDHRGHSARHQLREIIREFG